MIAAVYGKVEYSASIDTECVVEECESSSETSQCSEHYDEE